MAQTKPFQSTAPKGQFSVLIHKDTLYDCAPPPHSPTPTPLLLSPFINIHWQPLCRAAPVEVFNTGKQTSQTYAYCSSPARAFWLLCTGNTSPVFPGTQKPFLLPGTTELQIRMSTSAREQYVHCFCSLKDGHVCAYINL